MGNKIHQSGNPYFSLLKTAWNYAFEERKRFLLVYGMLLTGNLIFAVEPIIWGLYINELQKQGPNLLKLSFIYVAVLFGLRMAGWLLHRPARVMERSLAFNVSRNFLQDLYHKVVHLPVKWHQDHHSGATISRVKKAFESLKYFFERGFMYLDAATRFIFSLGAILYFSPLFGSLALLLGIGTILLILRFDKPFINSVHEVNEREHVLSSNLFDSLSNIITVITLRLEKRMERGLSQKIGDVLPPFRKMIRINEWKWFSVDICVALIYCVILVGYVWQNWTPGTTFLIGGLVSLVSYINRFTGVFHNIAWQYTEIVRYDTNVKSTQNILEAYEQQHLPEGEQRLPNNWQELEIRQLNFLHDLEPEPGKPAPGLHDLEFRLARKQKVALIGKSGSGKSTLLSLLRGLYDPMPGSIVTVDGEPVEGFDTIGNRVTLMPQEPEIFENTLEYNITLGLPFSREEVERVCDVAHFSQVVTDLPEGLNSNIREKGVNLSGGQKQRLALARGVLAARDSDIILLDEPTSSVDPKTEIEIYEKMFRQFEDKAVVSSLHRLHLLRYFDYIYIMDQGRVIDEGTFTDLMGRSRNFRELWEHQEHRMAG